MRLLNRLEVDNGLRHSKTRCLDFHRIRCPNGFQRVDAFVRAFAARVPGCARRFILVGRPTNPKTNPQAATRQDVERRQSSCQQNRVVPREVQHTGPEGNPIGAGSHESQRFNRVQHPLVFRWENAISDRIRRARIQRVEQAIKDPDTVKAELLGMLSDAGYRIRSRYGSDLWQGKSNSHLSSPICSESNTNWEESQSL